MINKIKCLDFELQIENPPNDISIQQMLSAGQYEPHVQFMMRRFVKPEMACLDIGANVGIHSLLLSKLAKKVECIEGSKNNIELLKKNFALNNIPVPKVHCEFLGDGNPVEFSYTDDYHACAYTTTTNFKRGCSSDINSNLPKHTTTIVQTKKLSDIIDYQPDFIKMDIEGAEYNTIMSSIEIFKNVKCMIVELNKWTNEAFFNQSINLLIDLLCYMYETYILYNGVLYEVDRYWLYSFFQKNLMIDVLCVSSGSI